MEVASWDGVRCFLDKYVGLSEDEHVLLIYTSECQDVLVALAVALAVRQIPTTRVWMHPLADPGLKDRLDNAIGGSIRSGGSLVIVTLERETFSHAEAIALFARESGFANVRIFRMISACPELLSTALRASPAVLEDLNATLLAAFVPAKTLNITTRSGSDFTVGLNAERYRWISNRGLVRQGRVVVLPAGEVATYPATVDGTFVADFAFNINCTTDADARLDVNPVRLILKGGRVKSFSCKNKEVCELVESVLVRDNGDRVGELGFGTNPFVNDPIPLNSHINERRRGVHLGLGQHNQSQSDVNYYCQVHLDLIARGGRVMDPDRDIAIDLEQVVPLREAKPLTGASVHDEDVFSPDEVRIEEASCCGEDVCAFLD